MQIKILQMKISRSFPISCPRKTQLIANALPVQPFFSYIHIHRVITTRIIATVGSEHTGKDQFYCCVVGSRKGSSNVTAWDDLPTHSSPTPTISYPDPHLFLIKSQDHGCTRKTFNCNLPPRAFYHFCDSVDIFISPKQ